MAASRRRETVTMDSSKKSGFSEAEVKAVLQSKAGQQLLQLLKKDGGNALSGAIAAIQSGDYAKAFALMQPIMTSEDAVKLVKEINQNRG